MSPPFAFSSFSFFTLRSTMIAKKSLFFPDPLIFSHGGPSFSSSSSLVFFFFPEILFFSFSLSPRWNDAEAAEAANLP